MGCSPVMDPFGGPTILVDRLLGNAYEVVKFVARQMPIIKQLSDNMQALVTVANGGAGIPATASGASLLIPGTIYVPDTSGVAGPPISQVLPPRANVNEGQFVGVFDAMNNAAVNNIVVSTPDGAQISDHGVANLTHTITNSYSVTLYFNRNGLWRAVQYGG